MIPVSQTCSTSTSRSGPDDWGRRVRTIPLMLAATGLGLLACPLVVAVAAIGTSPAAGTGCRACGSPCSCCSTGSTTASRSSSPPCTGSSPGSAPGWTSRRRSNGIDGFNDGRSTCSPAVPSSSSASLRARSGCGRRLPHRSRHRAVPARQHHRCLAADAALPAPRPPHPVVIMAELLADPGFDLIYARTGSVFITRDSGPDALAAVRRMAPLRRSEHGDGDLPQGRLYRPDRLARALARLQAENRAGRTNSATLRHVPPRPGGVLASSTRSPATSWSSPMPASTATRAPRPSPARSRSPTRSGSAPGASRADIPDGDDDRIAWLDEQWRALDDWIAGGDPSR